MALRPIDFLEGTAVVTPEGRQGVVISVWFRTGALLLAESVLVKLDGDQRAVYAPEALTALIRAGRVRQRA